MPRASKSKKAVADPITVKSRKLAAPNKKNEASATAKKASAPVKAATKALKKNRKARVGNVRELILKALKRGSQTRPALQKATGASYNGLVMHLSKLKNEGLVAADSSNRMMSLVDAPAGATPSVAKMVKAKRAKPTFSTSLALVPIEATVLPMTVTHARDVLSDAINQLKDRLSRAENIEDKLLVLDALASQIGGPVAEVLMGIKADLLR